MDAIDIFPWDDHFNTGIPRVDEQHRRLVQLLNDLASHIAFNSDVTRLTEIFDELAAYTAYHFGTEEEIWHQYLGADDSEARHRALHGTFVSAVERLRRDLSVRSPDELAEEALGFLARWLASHILESDRFLAYVVLGLREGLDLAAAKTRAAEQMSGATRRLIDLVLSIYESLSTNTLRLMRELSERKKQHDALIQARVAAEAANVAKSRFLANTSHEIRTPLNAILGMAQLLQAPDVSAADRQDYADTIVSAGRSLLGMLQDVLDVAGVEAGSLEIRRAPVDARALVSDVHAHFLPAAQGKGLTVEADATGLPQTVYLLDAQRVRQMLGHLMSNALKFTAHGALRLEAREVAATAEGPLVEFAVVDSGVGVPADKQPLLFQPFSQVDSSSTRAHGGSGLGLSVVRALAELMGGEVGLRSQQGLGSRFWFRVPAPRG